MKQHKLDMIPEKALGPWADGANDTVRTVRKGPRLREQDTAEQANGVSVQNRQKPGTWVATTLFHLQIPKALPRTWQGIGPRQTVRHIHHLKKYRARCCVPQFVPDARNTATDK